MTYVDGFVAAVPTANKEQYIQFVRKSAMIFKRHGALKLVECWGDDVPDGKLTSFPMAVKCQPDETVVFSWVLWPSKAARDEGMKKVMADHEAEMTPGTMPFDGKRMIYGGFEVVSET
jgi:uncharacterized protein YbaA (DUF1428 family)